MILRDDDIFLTESPRGYGKYYNLEKFKQAHKLIKDAGYKHLLAIIASEIPNYQALKDYIKANKDDFKFAIHGWNHERYSEWPEEGIYLSLERAKKRVEKVFGKVKYFCPPWNKRSDTMYKACDRLGLKVQERFIVPGEALEGKTSDALCFHYWNDEEINKLKECFTQPSLMTTMNLEKM